MEEARPVRGRHSASAGIPVIRPDAKGDDLQASSEHIREQLERILASPAFKNSKRYSRFFRFIVERTLDGQSDLLKERTIGTEVFERPPDYDSSSDHIVRSAAGEVRRRLAQYYQNAPNHEEIRIELHPGSYVPQFLPAFRTTSLPETPPSPAIELAPEQPIRTRKRWLLALVFGIVAIASFLLGTLWPTFSRTRPDAFHQFWNPILTPTKPVLLCTGENGSDARQTPELGDMRAMTHLTINIEDAITVTRLSSALQEEHSPWRILTESATTFDDLKEHSAVLIGAFNNDWTMRLTHDLPFRFERDPNHPRAGIIRNKQDTSKKVFTPTLSTPNGDVRSEYVVTKDYAIVSRERNRQTGQMVVVAAGITGYGTTAAGDFLGNPTYLRMLAQRSPAGWELKNVEVILSTDVIKGIPGPPNIIASYVW